MSTQEQAPGRERINGVFSSQEVKRIGTGTTLRKTIQKAFWFCDELADGNLEVQPLNSNYVRSGPKKVISSDQFLASFSPEPELYVSSVFPKMRELNKTIARADRHRKNSEFYSAEMEYGNAIKVDEENVRANFGLGITYLERGETGKADDIVERLVKLDAACEPEHKHLFNEFGIQLRKNGMLDQAVDYYNRAMGLAAKDEHLFHNLARAYLEKKDYAKAVDYLLVSLDLNPSLESSVKFLLWMVNKSLVPEEKKPAVASMLKRVKQEQQRTGATPAENGATASSQTASS